jgi:hypothetical protein
MSGRKVNPRWEKAPREQVFLNRDGSIWEPPQTMTYPGLHPVKRYELTGELVPPFLIEQPDGTWKESW